MWQEEGSRLLTTCKEQEAKEILGKSRPREDSITTQGC